MSKKIESLYKVNRCTKWKRFLRAKNSHNKALRVSILEILDKKEGINV